MKGLRITSECAELGADFFKGSRIEFLTLGGSSSGSSWNIYEALNGKFLLRQESRFSSRKITLGEITQITLDNKFLPKLNYFAVSWPEGRKCYGDSRNLKLEVRDIRHWREFLLDSESRQNSSFPLYLPDRVFLEKPCS